MSTRALLWRRITRRRRVSVRPSHRRHAALCRRGEHNIYTASRRLYTFRLFSYSLSKKKYKKWNKIFLKNLVYLYFWMFRSEIHIGAGAQQDARASIYHVHLQLYINIVNSHIAQFYLDTTFLFPIRFSMSIF